MLLTVLTACAGSGDRAALREHVDGEGALQSQGDTAIGQAVDALGGVTRTLGGMPLCLREGTVATLERVEPARVLGDVRVEFVGVRDTRYRSSDAGADEAETLAPSTEGTLPREDFADPSGFPVEITCDEAPRIVEVALEYTFTSERGGVIDGVRVEYRDDQDNPFRFVAQRTVVGCGTGQLEPRFQEICEERAGKP